LTGAAAESSCPASHAEARTVVDAFLLHRHQDVVGLFQEFVDAIEGIPFARAAVQKLTVVASEFRGFILNVDDLEGFF